MEIKLGGKNGGIALVSAQDYELVNKHNWHKNYKGYVCGMVNGKNLQMHRFIMDPNKKDKVDILIILDMIIEEKT